MKPNRNGRIVIKLPKQARRRPQGPVGQIRSATSTLMKRSAIATRAGLTFTGKRDLYEALGYKKNLTYDDYRGRYDRNAIAARVVESFPKATWRGGGELVEDPNPELLTDFEEQFFLFTEAHALWSKLLRGDILAGLGQFACVLLGAPGKLDSELPKSTNGIANIAFIKPYSEEQVDVTKWENDTKSPRFGFPIEYQLKEINRTVGLTNFRSGTRSVHWTRVLHIADGLLDDEVTGQPRLERCWNLLDDLEKVTGGGSEAFWMRAHQGYQFDLDKDMELDPEDEEDFEEEVDEFVHGMKRVVKSRGVKMTALGSDVANFNGPTDAIITQIAGGSGIPKRLLVGSERGDLASTQDRSNWTERVNDRRTQYAGPLIVRTLVDRLIKYKYLPTPAQYEVRWPTIQSLDEIERADVAKKWTSLNNDFKDETVVTVDEVRDLLLGLPPKAEEEDESTTSFEGEEIEPIAAAANANTLLKFNRKKPKSIKALVEKKRLAVKNKTSARVFSIVRKARAS